MKIQWLGHACFLLTASNGTRVLTDPFDPKIGYPAPAVEAQIVTTSHQHSDHNYTQVVKGSFRVIAEAGSFSIQDISIQGVQTFHDDEGGSKRGSNLVFCFTIDGVRVAHCGDLGHRLTPQQVQDIGAVDVLLVPVGGFYTIDAQTAKQTADDLQATVIIPMHFKVPVLDFPIAAVDTFLQTAGGGRRAGSMEIEVTRQSLAAQAGVIVLDYPTA